MQKRFSPERLSLARKRRQLTIKALAAEVNLSPRMVSEYEKDYCAYSPTDETVNAFSRALRYPAEFFFLDDKVEFVDDSTVSFRSLKSMKASQMHAAIAAGSLGLLLDDFIHKKFDNLPRVNLPDLRGVEPEAAAEALRDFWDLGNCCVDSMVHLLEKHGVRVFSLAENTAAVDAFSFWKDGRPYVFLNTQKSGERGRMDAAHELAHLVMHRHRLCQGRDAEAEADRFAACFLMPGATVLSVASQYLNLDDVLALRSNWGVSAMALIMQLRFVGAITEWHHRNLIVEASKLGLRRNEIGGIPRERTLLLDLLLRSLADDGVGLSQVAADLKLPVEEVSNLVFRMGVVQSGGGALNSAGVTKPDLMLVK